MFNVQIYIGNPQILCAAFGRKPLILLTPGTARGNTRSLNLPRRGYTVFMLPYTPSGAAITASNPTGRCPALTNYMASGQKREEIKEMFIKFCLLLVYYQIIL